MSRMIRAATCPASLSFAPILLSLSLSLSLSLHAEDPPPSCPQGAPFKLTVQGSATGGATWNSDLIYIYGLPGTQIDVAVRTLLTLSSGQTQGWSFSLEHDGAYMTATGVTTAGTGTATVQGGYPPASNATSIRAPSTGFTQGVLIDSTSEITLVPVTNFVTARACYRINLPSQPGLYQAKLRFTHALGAPPVRSVITQSGLSNVPCARNFTFYLFVDPEVEPTVGGCSLQGAWASSAPSAEELEEAVENPGPIVSGEGLGPWGMVPEGLPIPPFSCGDANADGKFDISDPIFVLTYLFAAGLPPCLVNSRLLKTGQSFTQRSGDDGSVQAGLSLGYEENTDNDNVAEAVNDLATGLVWTKKPLDRNKDGSITHPADTFQTGTGANSASDFIAKNLNPGLQPAVPPWRLPSLRELLSIVDYNLSFTGQDPHPSANSIFWFLLPPPAGGAGLRYWTSSEAIFEASPVGNDWYDVNFAVGHNWNEIFTIPLWARAVRNHHFPPHTGGPPMPFLPFWCGDSNADGLLDIADPIYALNYLFLGGTAPCLVDVPIPAMVPPPGRFVDNGNLTVTDLQTGLTWWKAPPDILFSWEDAVDFAWNHPLFADHDDWRLPNARELQSLADYSKTNTPLLDPVFQLPPPPPGASYHWPFFWTSTSDQGNTTRAFKMGFGSGDLHNSSLSNDKVTDRGFAWPVRGGLGVP